jgi:hypothetical protein
MPVLALVDDTWMMRPALLMYGRTACVMKKTARVFTANTSSYILGVTSSAGVDVGHTGIVHQNVNVVTAKHLEGFSDDVIRSIVVGEVGLNGNPDGAEFRELGHKGLSLGGR